MMVDGKPNENSFGNSWFELGICIVSTLTNNIINNIDNNNNITISSKLLFENGDNVGNDIELLTNPSNLKLDNSDGTIRFNVKIDTLSMYHDNRQFKIVFSVNDSPKHINSVTTNPFRLVYVLYYIFIHF